MFVRVVRPLVFFANRTHAVGDIVEVSEEIAKTLITRGLVIPSEGPPVVAPIVAAENPFATESENSEVPPLLKKPKKAETADVAAMLEAAERAVSTPMS